MSAVRRSCQTMARWMALPVDRSQTTVVSRWLVIPIAAMSLAARPAFFSASRQVATVEFQMSSGLCSTQPEDGKCCGNPCCATPATERSLRNTVAREDVVPWSMANTKDMNVSRRYHFAQGKRIGERTSSWRWRQPSTQMSSPRRRGPITTGHRCYGRWGYSLHDNISLWLWVPDRTRLRLTCPGHEIRELHPRGGHTAVDHDGLPGHEARGVRTEIGDGTGDFIRFADPAQRRGGAAALQPLFVLPQRAGEISFHEARRDAIDAYALRAPFGGEA